MMGKIIKVRVGRHWTRERGNPPRQEQNLTLTTVAVMSMNGQYAIAHARATIHDGGIADLVDLQFDIGIWRRAHIAPEWLRLGAQLSGSWHVTLYFRTGPDGRLKEMPYIMALRAVRDNDPSFSWEAVGKLTQVNPDSCWVTFRVRPDSQAVKPFLLQATIPPALIGRFGGSGEHRLTGTLQDERLLIENITVIKPQE